MLRRGWGPKGTQKDSEGLRRIHKDRNHPEGPRRAQRDSEESSKGTHKDPEGPRGTQKDPKGPIWTQRDSGGLRRTQKSSRKEGLKLFKLVKFKLGREGSQVGKRLRYFVSSCLTQY